MQQKNTVDTRCAQEIFVKQGDSVGSSQAIARADSAGRSTGPQ